MTPVTRQHAIGRGLKRYFTGLACLRGHVAERYVLNGGCVECMRQAAEEQQRKIKVAREAANAG